MDKYGPKKCKVIKINCYLFWEEKIKDSENGGKISSIDHACGFDIQTENSF